MKKTLFAAIFLSLCSFAHSQERVYLSATGSDNGLGSADSPFLTLERALDGQLSTTRTDTLFVEVGSGDYFMTRPLQISRPNSRPIVIRATDPLKARMLGGVEVSGWEHFKDGIYRSFIPEVVQFGFDFEQFYVDGKRATPARTPNSEWYFIKGHKEISHVAGGRLAAYATQALTIDSLAALHLSQLDDQQRSQARFRFYHKWDITQKKADYIEADSSRIYFSGTGMKPWNPVTAGSRYVISGYMSALDSVGEWYLDRDAGYVYYKPLDGEDLSTAFCVAPTIEKWVVFKGEPLSPLSNITFDGISFEYASLMMPEGGNDPMQAAASIGAAMEFDFCENISILNSQVMHTGGYGIWFKQECHNNTIDHCYVADLGAGGIKIGEPYMRDNGRAFTSGNVVNNSIITHAGSVLPCGVGVAIFHSSDNRVTHNEISDLRYSGVSVGWVWGYNASENIWTNTMNDNNQPDYVQMKLVSPAVNNYVAYNHIHHIGWGELSDMGAVYTLGESYGTKITHNIIHDILSYDYGGWGLYTDEGSTGVEMSYNLAYRCKSGGFHQHYGRDNMIFNNILAFGYYYQVQYTRGEAHRSFTFERNIILHNQGVTLASGAWESGKVDMDYNLYCNLSEPVTIGKQSFSEWRKTKEPHSIEMDPGFVDALGDDFTFKSQKAIRKIGFEPLDYSAVGVYGSDEWKTRAQLSQQTLDDFSYVQSVRLNK